MRKLCIVVCAVALSAGGTSLAKAAGGAFAVDDSEIGKPGDCKVESWAAFANNRDGFGVISPACVVNVGIPVEAGAFVQRSRTGGDMGEYSTSGGLKAKINILPVDARGIGIGLAGAISYDFRTDMTTGYLFNVPVQFKVTDDFRVNVNGGYARDSVADIGYASWGVGFEWAFYKPVTLIAEIYGISGRLPEVGIDEVPQESIRRPRGQVGLRFTPKDAFDIDVIYGRNITGEDADWLTLGVNLRF